MRCLTIEECSHWLAASRLKIRQAPFITDSVITQLRYAVTENTRSREGEYCRVALGWLPDGRERLFIAEQWFAWPHQSILVDAVRRGYGVDASRQYRPGYLFESYQTSGDEFYERSPADVQEEAIAIGITSLMLEWQCAGDLVVHGCNDIVHLGDGFICFESACTTKVVEAEELIRGWGLPVLSDFPWQ